jgi:hypothetical protein
MEQVFGYIIGLGAAVMMPIIFTILGVCIGIKFSKALKSGLLVGVGFVGLSVVTALLTSSLGPALSQVVEIYGLQLKVFDMGWPAAAAVAYNTSVGAFIIPVCLGVNLLMLLTKTTRTVNIDLWNYWHFAFIGAVVYFAIGKFILIGDHKQLPAVVLQSSEQSEVCDEALQAIGLYNLKDSLFERLYRNLSKESANRQASTSHSSSFIPHPSYDMLCRQGRMNIEVALFPNRAFYGGLLEPVGLPHQQGELILAPELCDCEFAGLLTRRVAFLPAAVEPPAQSAKMNHSEARIVARLAAAIYRQYAAVSGFNPAVTLGVITPYRSQIALIKKEIAALGIAPLEDILVDTVERFQGSERDVIIYSFCVNRAYQLKFLANMTEENGTRIDRKLNVALTRARKQMFMTGVPQLLKLNPIYAELLSVVCHS